MGIAAGPQIRTRSGGGFPFWGPAHFAVLLALPLVSQRPGSARARWGLPPAAARTPGFRGHHVHRGPGLPTRREHGGRAVGAYEPGVADRVTRHSAAVRRRVAVRFATSRRWWVIVGVRWLEKYFLTTAPQKRRVGIRTLFQELLRVERAHRRASVSGAFVRRSHHAHRYQPLSAAGEEDFHVAGGRVVVRDFPIRRRWQRRGPVVVTAPARARRHSSATGIGACERALVVLARSPEVDYITTARSGVMYLMPNGRKHPGGSFVQGDATTTPIRLRRRRILRGHADLFGGMA